MSFSCFVVLNMLGSLAQHQTVFAAQGFNKANKWTNSAVVFMNNFYDITI